MSRESTQAIEGAASGWLIRRDLGHWTESDEAQLQAWLEASSLHRVAFWRLEMAWEEAARLKALGAGVASVRPPPRGDWNLTPFFECPLESDDSKGASQEFDSDNDHPLESHSDTHSLDERARVAAICRDLAAADLVADRDSLPNMHGGRKLLGFATAAMVLLSLAAGGYLWFQPHGDRYATPIGGLASVPLRDGSRIILNTATEVRVALTGKERDIELTRGEAFFEVAHDATRPFVVNVGNRRVIAVGTQFSVYRKGDDIRVVVSEGTVRLESRDRPHRVQEDRERKLSLLSGQALSGSEAGSLSSMGIDSSSGGSAEVTLLPAGSVAHAGSAGVLVQKEALSKAQEQLSWRTGVLMFRDQTLAEAAAEFNRYNELKIVIKDPTIAALEIEGNFRATNVEAFVRLVESGFPVRATKEDSQIVLSAN